MENLELNTKAQQEFVVFKSYEGYPSKNSIQFTGTEEECKDYLQRCLSVSHANGVGIISEGDYSYTCENYDNNNSTVTFEVKKA